METAREETSLGFLPKYWLRPALTLALTLPLSCPPQAFAYQVGSLHVPRLTSLFGLDDDIVCGLEQVTAALACEGQIGKLRAGPRVAKMCCLTKDEAGFMEEFLTVPQHGHPSLLLGGGFPLWIYNLKPGALGPENQ